MGMETNPCAPRSRGGQEGLGKTGAASPASPLWGLGVLSPSPGSRGALPPAETLCNGMGTAWSSANRGTDSAIVSQGGGTSPLHLNTGEEPTPAPQITPFSAPGSMGPPQTSGQPTAAEGSSPDPGGWNNPSRVRNHAYSWQNPLAVYFKLNSLADGWEPGGRAAAKGIAGREGISPEEQGCDSRGDPAAGITEPGGCWAGAFEPRRDPESPRFQEGLQKERA